jgi:uncharacterized tellurite resistance protein B-like protein
MWQRLLQRLQAPPAADETARRRLACAVLLLECARADFEHHEAELDTVRAALSAHFGLAPDELDALIAEAGDHARRAVSLHDYVERLNRGLDAADKRRILDLLWRVAYADGRVDPHEEHLLRRLADLLHLPHRDYIAAKLAAAGHG